MKALVIGATGATGIDLVHSLLNDNAYSAVHVFVRKEMGVKHPKLFVHMVDFENPESWAEKIQGDVAFSCMGTTLKSAGSKEAQWKIDYTYQLDFARNAFKNGVPSFFLVSSMNAKADSTFFYMRMKGRLEKDISDLGFRRVVIVRPPMLIRKNTDRSAEKIGLVVIRCFNAIGLLKNMTPMETKTVARVMLHLSKEEKTGLCVYESRELAAIANTLPPRFLE